MKNNKVSSTEYFESLKKRASIELFNLEHSSKTIPNDIDIVKMSLKNMIFYADKKLATPSEAPKSKAKETKKKK